MAKKNKQQIFNTPQQGNNQQLQDSEFAQDFNVGALGNNQGQQESNQGNKHRQNQKQK